MSFCQYYAYPTTWTEFVEAIATPETAVHLPENAIWDMNDFVPEGISNTVINIMCDRIFGNGTEIKNLKLTESYFKLRSESSASNARLEFWDSLHLTNMVVSNSYPNSYLFMGGSRVSSIDGQTIPSADRHVICQGSMFSGLISHAASQSLSFRVFGGMLMSQSSCNLELLLGSGSVKSFTLGYAQDYCNFKVAIRGFTKFDAPNGLYRDASYSWFDLYGDDLTDISVTKGAHACIFRCSAPITTVAKAAAGYPSIVSVPDPLTVVLPEDSNLIVCTDAQCRDANWLHDAGFPIAVDP